MNKLKSAGKWIALISIAIGLLPVFSVVLADIIATLAHCEINEAIVPHCGFLGADIGSLLYVLFVAGWFALITIPVGGAGALIGLIMYTVGRIGGRRTL